MIEKEHTVQRKPGEHVGIELPELAPEVHKEIHKQATAGKPLGHFDPEALMAYALTGTSDAHYRAQELARQKKIDEFEKINAKLPFKLKPGFKRAFEEILQKYPEPKKDIKGYA